MGRPLSDKEFREALKNRELIGLKCDECGFSTATPKQFCMECGSDKLSRVKFSGKGKILTYTVINVPPARFKNYGSYGVAVVKLAEGATIMGRIANETPPKTGQEVAAVFIEKEKGKVEVAFKTTN